METILFRPIELSLRKHFEERTAASPLLDDYLGSELNFQNLMTWKAVDDIEYAILEDGTLLLRGATRGADYFLPPVAQDERSFLAALKRIEDDAVAANVPFLVNGLTERMVDLIRRSDRPYRIAPEPDYDEYLYESEALRSLSGNRYSKKRNLIHQFDRNYAYDFRACDEADLPLVLDLLDRWNERKGQNFERTAIAFALRHLDEMGCFADLILVDGKAVAFSLGTKTALQGIVLFEKADTDYIGSFQAINALFAGRHFADVPLINRQEDLGIEELRRAKRSYHPVGFVRKYSLTRLSLTDAEVAGLERLYAEAFDDSESYRRYFFAHKVSAENAVFRKRGATIVSALHLVMKTAVVRGVRQPLPFIVAAATLPAFRRQGEMRAVLRNAFQELRNRGLPFVALSPFDEHFYRRFGFAAADRAPLPCGADEGSHVYAYETITRERIGLVAALYRARTGACDVYIERDDDAWMNLFDEVEADGGRIVLMRDHDVPTGYYMTFPSGTEETCMPAGTIPADAPGSFPATPSPTARLMFRVVDAKAFLRGYSFPADADFVWRVRIRDEFFPPNDVTIEVVASHGEVRVRDVESGDETITAGELAERAFGVGGFPFGVTKTVIFDRY